MSRRREKIQNKKQPDENPRLKIQNIQITNSAHGRNNHLDTTEKKKISELEERAIETIQLRHGDKKRWKRLNKKSVNCGKWSNVREMRVLEGEEKENMWKKIHFNSLPPDLIKKINPEI